MTTPVHFVGSIGLDTVDEVFSTVGRAHLRGRSVEQALMMTAPCSR